MNFGDTLVTVFIMVLCTCIFFIFPLMLTANESDIASQVSLQTSMTDFVNEICDTGKITKENYDKFIQKITGPNTYNIEIEIKILDENPSKKITSDIPTQTGENVFISYYTSQVIQQLDDTEKGNCLLLKEGDQIHVSISNTNSTLSQQLSIPLSSDISMIVAETVQTCTVNGM